MTYHVCDLDDCRKEFLSALPVQLKGIKVKNMVIYFCHTKKMNMDSVLRAVL